MKKTKNVWKLGVMSVSILLLNLSRIIPTCAATTPSLIGTWSARYKYKVSAYTSTSGDWFNCSGTEVTNS